MLPVDTPLIRRAHRRSSRVRLFCLPYAGAGSSIFGSWPDRFPPSVEIATIQLPGREDRQSEAPFTELEPMVRTITAALRPYLLTPMALFGHCAGALLAYEVAAECRRRFGVQPRHLFLAGQGAPDLPPRNAPVRHLADADFKEQLREFDGFAPEALADDNLMSMLLPCLRADFTLWETYEYRERTPMSCPITTFTGSHDPRTDPADVAAWEKHTTGPFAMRVVEGGHFFVNDNPDELIKAMAEALS